MRAIFVLAIAPFLLFAGLQPSLAGDWTVARITGKAWLLEEGFQPRSLEGDMTIPEGASVQTARNGRVRLEKSDTSMMLGPNTVAEVKKQTLVRRRTTVMQKAGTIEFDVEKRGRPHFEVQTPYLAAVVKGTHFSIRVSRNTSSISVDEGLVGVTDEDSGEEADVGAGQRASAGVNRSGLSTSPGVTKSSPSGGNGAASGRSATAGIGSSVAASTGDSESGGEDETPRRGLFSRLSGVSGAVDRGARGSGLTGGKGLSVGKSLGASKASTGNSNRGSSNGRSHSRGGGWGGHGHGHGHGRGGGRWH